jgi:serine/threonine-protein kinase HipA
MLAGENRPRLSISGVQEKYSLVIQANDLRLPTLGERAQYILKPVPAGGVQLPVRQR